MASIGSSAPTPSLFPTQSSRPLGSSPLLDSLAAPAPLPKTPQAHPANSSLNSCPAAASDPAAGAPVAQAQLSTAQAATGQPDAAQHGTSIAASIARGANTARPLLSRLGDTLAEGTEFLGRAAGPLTVADNTMRLGDQAMNGRLGFNQETGSNLMGLGSGLLRTGATTIAAATSPAWGTAAVVGAGALGVGALVNDHRQQIGNALTAGATAYGQAVLDNPMMMAGGS